MERMVDYVLSTKEKYPNHIAYDFLGNRCTYSGFAQEIEEAAKALCAIGVTEDDIVCIMMPNMPQAITLLYAANRIGAVVNMIHPLSSEEEIAYFVSEMGAKTLLVIDQFYDKVERVRARTGLTHVIVASAAEALPPLKRVGYALTDGRKVRRVRSGNGVIRWNDFLCVGKGYALPERGSNREEKTAIILYSGGTTGKVKGVCLSNKSVNESAKQMMAANPMIDASDRFLSVMPIFHGNGLVIGVHVMLMLGARCVFVPRFTPESYARDLLKSKCNYMSGVPALYLRLMEVPCMQSADLSFLKGVFSGADSLSVEQERKINAFLKEHHSPVPVRQGYGMTEGVVASSLMPAGEQREGSIGKALPGVEMKIVEPGGERELPAGETGEIVFSSVTNMMGYYNNPTETALVLRTHADGKMWIHSGDLGYVDEEGYFFFRGRSKRMIVTNGYNVFPGELESIIEGFEMVDRCCIVGVASAEGTERIKAFVVLSQGYEASQETKDAVLSLCRKAIAKYAIPKEIEFIGELPKTKVGKVDIGTLTGQR